MCTVTPCPACLQESDVYGDHAMCCFVHSAKWGTHWGPSRFSLSVSYSKRSQPFAVAAADVIRELTTELPPSTFVNTVVIFVLVDIQTLFFVERMNTATSHLVAQLVQLRLNRDDADVTITCEGKVIKAHSFILGMRY